MRTEDVKISISFNLIRPAWVRLPNSTAVAPRNFEATIEDADARYNLEIELDTDGHSRCNRLEASGSVPALVEVPKLLRLATAAAAGTGTDCGEIEPGVFRVDAASDQEAEDAGRQQFRRAPARRRDTPTDDRLRAVGNAWSEHGGDIAAVAHDCQISQATAYRYLNAAKKRARELGLDPLALNR